MVRCISIDESQFILLPLLAFRILGNGTFNSKTNCFASEMNFAFAPSRRPLHLHSLNAQTMRANAQSTAFLALAWHDERFDHGLGKSWNIRNDGND